MVKNEVVGEVEGKLPGASNSMAEGAGANSPIDSASVSPPSPLPSRSDVEATPGPWTWSIHDHSMATLEGPRGSDGGDHVMSVSPCQSCANRAKADGGQWKWGRCTTPAEANARLIEASPLLYAALEEARNWLKDTLMLVESGRAIESGWIRDAIKQADAALRAARNGEDAK